MKNIAYIAPEIPTLSATFVYNEILSLREKGYNVIPISVHFPDSPVNDKRVVELFQETCYLYEKGWADLLLASVVTFLSSPWRYLKGFSTLCCDVWRVGCLNRIGMGLCYRFVSASRVAIIVGKEGCGHIHANFAHIPTDIAMYTSILTGTPFSFTSHANDLFERGWLLKEKVRRAVFATTISQYNVDYMVSKGADRNKITVIRCGVDSTRFSPTKRKLPTVPYKIGTIGRMVEKKGFDLLLKATSVLVRDNIKLTLDIAGGGPLEKELHSLADSLGLKGNVDFLGPMDNSAVCAWLRTLDLFVLPCRQDEQGDMDGIPVVLMEAMMSGVSVISTKISGIPELIRHEHEGLLVEPESIDELAEAMQTLLRNHALAEKVATNAFQYIIKEFDNNLNIERLRALLDS